MLVIRFFRVGKKNQPSFKIVVTDKRRAPRGGRFTEEVGFWSPLTKQRVLKEDRVKYWMSVGAQPSDTVRNLLIEAKILEGKKTPVHKVKKEKQGAGEQKPAAAAPVVEQKPAETPVAEVKPAEDKTPVAEVKPAEDKASVEDKEAKLAEPK